LHLVFAAADNYPIPAHLDAEKVHFSPVGLAFCVLTRF